MKMKIHNTYNISLNNISNKNKDNINSMEKFCIQIFI